MVALAVLGCATPLRAQPAERPPDAPVPAPLAPWVPWVLADLPERNCAFSAGRALCDWPGRLELALDAGGGRFSQDVLIDRDAPFALAGSAARWPLGVRVDGRAAAVLDLNGTPGLLLRAGSHRIEGRFEWKSLPERLEVPAGTALITLSVGGKPVAFPKRDEQGQLWLLGGASADQQAEQLGLSVTRKIEDGVPLLVTTRIKLRVAGRAREVSLGKVLLAGTAPLSLASELPARLEADGELRLQVRAGTYGVELRARSEGSPAQLAFRSAGAAWPESEVWVWQADEQLRQVELSGAPAVDPARTELDSDWRELPAFALRAGNALRLATVRRGEPAPPPNRLTLERELWLDLDGRGYTVRDRLQAELRQGFRLDLLAGELGHVSADGEDLLITERPGSKRAGVELRKASQALIAEWRAPERLATLPAVGWSEDVQSLGTTLHLGPGYSVLAARGVDGLSQSWLQDWDLFEFFFVLVVAAAVGRLAGRRFALLALFTLVLFHDEPEAPVVVWLVLLAAIALLRVLPAGWPRNLVRVGYAGTLAVLLLIALPFAVAQVRSALYPQLGGEGGGQFQLAMVGVALQAPTPMRAADAVEEEEMLEEAPAPSSPAPEAAAAPAEQKSAAPSREAGQAVRPESLKDDEYDTSSRAGSAGIIAVRKAQRALQQDPEATVQTGPGVPSWQWRTWQLRWSGPVDKAHELQLYLIPPPVNRALALLRVLLLAALIGVLWRAATPGRDKPGAAPPPAPPSAAAAAMLIALLALLGSSTSASVAHAQTLPGRDLLDQLRDRLTKPAECRPHCATIDELQIRISGQELELVAAVHAGERTSIRLPGPAAAWVPAELTLDGRTAPAVLLEDGFLHARIEPGIHELRARGPLPPSESLTLALLDQPHRARVQAEGWTVDGVREDGRVEGALQLSRLLVPTAGEQTAAPSAALPPWLLLERTLELGPSWELHTRLSRVSPPGTPLRVRVPLLAGESVTDAALEVTAGEVQVAFGRDDTEVAWSSRLAQSARIDWVAAKGRPFSERWTLVCGPIWRCELGGLTPTALLGEGGYQPRFVPWPGERVSIRVLRPEPARGQSVTIDSAQLDVTPGVRMLKASLDLGVRSSRGGTQSVRLPARARVQSLTVDGNERPLRVERDRLSFTLEPGAHGVRLQWQEAEGMAMLQRAPQVELSRAAANARVTINVPQERWLLWVGGPSWGPAVLFWGYLLLVVFAAVLLARASRLMGGPVGAQLPLQLHDFILLGLGLTQVPAAAALCVVGWFFALAYRARMRDQSRAVHNLTQIGLAFLSLGALSCLYAAVHSGLLLQPDMQVAGAGSSGNTLHWYVDRIAGALPAPSIVSAPMWLFRLLMLLWSLWLAARLMRWLPWAFACYRQGGLWRKRPPRRAPPPAAPPPAAPPVATPP